MIVSITGGRGFIGQSLVKKHLNQKDEVRVLSRKKFFNHQRAKLFVGDLVDNNENLSEFVDGADVLYHCAGEYRDKSLMYDLHIGGTQRLIDCSNGKIGRWVQLSSVGVYGVVRNGVISEEAQENPTGLYEKTKAKAEKLVSESGIPYVILRPSNVIGEKMSNQSVFQLIKMIEKGFFAYFGKSKSVVNYVHVDDVVNALMCCAMSQNSLGKKYNLSQTIEVEAMVNSILLGLNVKHNFLRLPLLPVRFFVKLFQNFPGFPLTISRIDALTGNSQYKSNKIIEELNFEFKSKLEEHFKLLAKLKSQS